MNDSKDNIVSLVYQGEFQAAEQMCKRLLAANPEEPELVFLLGNIYNRTGMYNDAQECYQRVLAVRPELPSAHYNLGCAYKNMGKLAEAANSIQTATQLKPDFHEAWDTLGLVYMLLGMSLEGVNCLKRALSIKPDYQLASENLGKAYQKAVSQWHFPMMNDHIRNDAYEQALKECVTPDTVVLDIGTGSGLLSLMAARAGARHVYTCDLNSLIADKAKEIIRANGYEDRITVLSMKSTDIVVGRDMPERADVLVSEILDVGLLAESVLPTVQHATSQLLKPGAPVIPVEADVIAVLLDSEQIWEEYYVNEVSGFDLSLFNEFSTREYLQIRIDDYAHTALSDPVNLFNIKLNGEKVLPKDVKINATAIEDGVCHAVAFWFRVGLSDSIHIDTGPGDRGCWKQAVMPLMTPLAVRKGDVAIIHAEHDRNRIRISDVTSG